MGGASVVLPHLQHECTHASAAFRESPAVPLLYAGFVNPSGAAGEMFAGVDEKR